MRCAEPMRHLGTVDIAPFAAALARQPEAIWDADAEFQKRLAPYRKSRSIYLMMTLGGPQAPTRHLAGWEPLREAFEPVPPDPPDVDAPSTGSAVHSADPSLLVITSR